MSWRVVGVFLLGFLLSCNFEEQDKIVSINVEKSIKERTVKYATGFKIQTHENYQLIILKNSWKNNNKTFKYVLYQNLKPKGVEGDVFLKTPIESIACMSLTHVAFIEKLGMEKSIIALSGCDYVSSARMNERIAKKAIREIGHGQNINYEMLVDESPDCIMGFGIDASSNALLNKLKSLGLQVVLNGEYMESHPLGKAEWIKFIAAFYNKDQLADSIFDRVEKRYLELKALTHQIKNKPTVFTGMPWSGAWHIPGGASYQAQLFKDAGAEYLWADNTDKSSLIKSKEVIFDQAIDADYWLNLNSFRSVDAVLGADHNFNAFKAVKQQQVYNNDLRLNEHSGNDYWESGVVNPHLILGDLIQVFHPEILNQELYYYRKLE